MMPIRFQLTNQNRKEKLFAPENARVPSPPQTDPARLRVRISWPHVLTPDEACERARGNLPALLQAPSSAEIHVHPIFQSGEDDPANAPGVRGPSRSNRRTCVSAATARRADSQFLRGARVKTRACRQNRAEKKKGPR